jgi:hypothetical protein
MKSRFTVPLVFSLFLILGSTIGLQAQVFDLAADFNSTSDSTTNEWAYGTFTSDPGSPSTFFIPSTINFNNTAITGLDIWFFPPSGAGDINDPNIEKNVTSSAIDPSGADWQPGKVAFGPFQGPAVAQFTAPTAGVYDISAAFQTIQINVLPTAYVYVGNTNVFTQGLTGPTGSDPLGTPVNFTLNDVTLNAGETVDFVVGNGLSTTQVDATITEVPEPSTYALMLGSLALLGFCLRRKSALFSSLLGQ